MPAPPHCRYKRRICADNGGRRGLGNEDSGLDGGSGAVADEERFALLAKIVRHYIADGAPNEINIR